MSWTAIAPSPTADATRLIDPCRTSLATNTPGWLDFEQVRITSAILDQAGLTLDDLRQQL
ncbi:MAG TPA: hypothetical protein VF317_11375 [Dermatophilaceae bacterium]